MEIKNISKHRPEGMVLDVAEEDAQELLKTGEFIKSTKEKLIIEKKPEVVEEDEEEFDDDEDDE